MAWGSDKRVELLSPISWHVGESRVSSPRENECLFGSIEIIACDCKLVVTLGEDDVKHVVEKLEGLRLELLKLRSMLVSEEKASPEELSEISQARDEIRRGESITLKALLDESGE